MLPFYLLDHSTCLRLILWIHDAYKHALDQCVLTFAYICIRSLLIVIPAVATRTFIIMAPMRLYRSALEVPGRWWRCTSCGLQATL